MGGEDGLNCRDQYVSSFDRIDDSKRNSLIVIGIYIAIIASFFWFVGALASNGIPAIASVTFGVLVGLLVCFVTYKRSGKMLAKMAGAHPVDRNEYPYLYEATEAIAAGCQINPPTVYVIETDELNAFASGSGSGGCLVAVTSGLLETLNREELEGVIAHEIAHLKNDDVKFISLAVALSATIIFLIRMLFNYSPTASGRWSKPNFDKDSGLFSICWAIFGLIFILLLPLITRIMESCLSKQREYLADANGATIIGYPLGLASALEKIEAYNNELVDSIAPEKKSTDQVQALCIATPVALRGGKFGAKLFSTHPPIEERIRRLRSM